MTACYEKTGIRFLYPENWEITDEQLLDDPKSVSVQSPESAFWSLMVYDLETEPQTLVEQVLDSMRGEYEGLECSVLRDQFGGRRLAGLRNVLLLPGLCRQCPHIGCAGPGQDAALHLAGRRPGVRADRAGIPGNDHQSPSVRSHWLTRDFAASKPRSRTKIVERNSFRSGNAASIMEFWLRLQISSKVIPAARQQRKTVGVSVPRTRICGP